MIKLSLQAIGDPVYTRNVLGNGYGARAFQLA